VDLTYGEPKLVVYDVPPTGYDVFRIVRADVIEDPAFLNSLRSHYELGEEPRRVERNSTAIHMGISVYMRAHMAHETAARFPKLGDYVARLELRAGLGVNLAQTGNPGHLTMWADPVKLTATVADIEPVQG
jgi:hypothetical protein